MKYEIGKTVTLIAALDEAQETAPFRRFLDQESDLLIFYAEGWSSILALSSPPIKIWLTCG